MCELRVQNLELDRFFKLQFSDLLAVGTRAGHLNLPALRHL